MAQILNTVNVTMQFAGLTAVDNVNIDQKEGEILALIGPNGAGKTTLFNMLTGVYKPTSGEIFYRGENITGLRPFQLVRKGITRTFQNIRLFKDMTTLENLLVASPDCKDEKIYLGEIIMCPAYIRKCAADENLDFQKEFVRAFSHSVLHLLGWEHGEKMFAIQDKVAQKS